MLGLRKNERLIFGVLAVVVASAGAIWATSGFNSQSVLLGRARFQPTSGDVLQVQRLAPPNWGVVLQSRGGLDVASQMITFQPGGHSGWHRHPGPVFISVIAGEMTFYESDDPSCTPIVRRAGEGYLDTGDHAHIARNESGAVAMNVVTYLAPPGAALRIDAPAPGNCPF